MDKIHKNALNGVLFSNGKTYIEIYEVPQNSSYELMLKNGMKNTNILNKNIYF